MGIYSFLSHNNGIRLMSFAIFWIDVYILAVEMLETYIHLRH